MEELRQPQDQPRMQSGACSASAPILAAGSSVTRRYLKARARFPGPAATAAASLQPGQPASNGPVPRRPAATTASRAAAASHTSAPQSPSPHKERERQHQVRSPLSFTKPYRQPTPPQPLRATFSPRGSVSNTDLELGRRSQPRRRGLWPRWPLDLNANSHPASNSQSPPPPLPPPQPQQIACAHGCVWPFPSNVDDHAHERQRRSHPAAAANGPGDAAAPLLKVKQPELMPAAARSTAPGNLFLFYPDLLRMLLQLSLVLQSGCCCMPLPSVSYLRTYKRPSENISHGVRAAMQIQLLGLRPLLLVVVPP